MKKLNIRCGKDTKKGYVNLDISKLPGVDIIHDLEEYPWPFKKDEFDEILCDNVLEHLSDIIKPMEELWRISKDKGIIKIWVPLYPGWSCFADPTHKKVFTYTTFNYFDPLDHLNYYSKARFKIKKRLIFFSSILRVLNLVVNLNETFQKAYYTLISSIFPPYLIYFELETVKK